MVNGGLKDMRRLRQLAKKILEERVAISRVAENQIDNLNIPNLQQDQNQDSSPQIGTVRYPGAT
jgi:hypothetical protein